MTAESALIEAQRRWGPRGKIFDRLAPEHAETFKFGCPVGRYWVGCPPENVDFNEEGEPTDWWPFGNGYSWERAFQDADDHPERRSHAQV